jgi:hypothetical protein
VAERLAGRVAGCLLLLLVASGCSLFSGKSPANTTKLTINDPYWDHVNVQFVITRSGDCDSREGLVSTRTIVMHKNTTESIDVPNDANLCWRHDRDPERPSPGAWSGWTKATLAPGQSAETEL